MGVTHGAATCDCGKALHRSYADAARAGKRSKRGKGQRRPYRCPEGAGWHLKTMGGWDRLKRRAMRQKG